MPDVAVLLSTWNGMEFLPQQIDSLLDQDLDGRIQILVRDDGSSDGTVAYLRARDPRITVIEGENLGPRDSFFALVGLARGLEADVFALCDQDDVWRSRKLSRAIAHLPHDVPALYASSLDLVDGNLAPIRTYQHPGDRSLASTLISNFATGCTCVFNRALLERLPLPDNTGRVLMHDWWLAGVTAAIGTVHYDPASSIAYRQHGANHVGIASGPLALARKVRKALTGTQAITRFDQARELQAALHASLDARQQEVLHAFLRGEHSRARRLSYVLRHARAVGIVAATRFVALG